MPCDYGNFCGVDVGGIQGRRDVVVAQDLESVDPPAVQLPVDRELRHVLVDDDLVPVDLGPAADPADGLAPPLTETVWLGPLPDAGITWESTPAEWRCWTAPGSRRGTARSWRQRPIAITGPTPPTS